VKLLFDHNLSPRLIARLTDVYPEATHVYLLGLDRALDLEVWQYASENGCIIITRDADFSELSQVHGFPPKVIWIRRGNCPTSELEAMLRANLEAITELDASDSAGVLTLF
jgi:predicted nuclease of predicted toxin-antitoxin system